MARSRRDAAAHLDRETLLEHAEGASLLPPASAHLGACGGCADAYAEIRDLVLDLRSQALAVPPEALVARAVGLFPARPPLLERVIEAIGRLVRVEGGLTPAMAGVRGSALSFPARMLYSDAAAEVDLELTDAPDGLRLVGQALAPDGGPLEGIAWVERAAWRSPEVPLGAHGVFQVDRLPVGALDLVLDLVLDGGGGRRVRFPVRPEEGRATTGTTS